MNDLLIDKRTLPKKQGDSFDFQPIS